MRCLKALFISDLLSLEILGLKTGGDPLQGSAKSPGLPCSKAFLLAGILSSQSEEGAASTSEHLSCLLDKYNDFIEANRIEDSRERMKTLRKLVRTGACQAGGAAWCHPPRGFGEVFLHR